MPAYLNSIAFEVRRQKFQTKSPDDTKLVLRTVEPDVPREYTKAQRDADIAAILSRMGARPGASDG